MAKIPKYITERLLLFDFNRKKTAAVFFLRNFVCIRVTELCHNK